ncbi:MAG: Rne/Rng family ribonuclease [bacterium]
MSKKILVNVGDEEIRVAVVVNEKLAEYYTERKGSRGSVGNICKGVVSDVLPGLQSVFIEIGLEKRGFLHINDVSPYTPGDLTSFYEARLFARLRPRNVQNLFQKGQEVIVQVAKEGIGMKGPKLTTGITLPGRYLVLMPRTPRIGISHRISNEKERRRLKNILGEIKPKEHGFILRTASQGKSQDDLKKDSEQLIERWSQILEKAKNSRAPVLLYRDIEMIPRVVRDIFTEDVDKIITDDKDSNNEIRSYLETNLPNLTDRLELYKEPFPLFDAYGIEDELKKLYKKKVWLKSGGYIVIDQMEALTSIDVNTGKFIGGRDYQKTILKTNLEAAEEMARQVRLRDIGGIIIVDFIDMDNENDGKKVLETFSEALKNDRSRPYIHELSQLGLVEMTRKRIRESVMERELEPCPFCKGEGKIPSPSTFAIMIEREINRHFMMTGRKHLTVKIHPLNIERIKEKLEPLLSKLSRNINGSVTFIGDYGIILDEIEIV